MSFSILDRFILGKGPDPSKCEDRIVCTEHFAAVIDGATSKSDLDLGDKTQGLLAGELIDLELQQLARDATADVFIQQVNARFQAFYQQRDLLETVVENPVDRLNASIAVYSDARKEVWLIGDCQCLIGQQHETNEKLIDSVLAHMRSLVLETALRSGTSMDELLQRDIGREAILPFLKRQQLFQNADPSIPYAYGTLDGFPVSPEHYRVFPVAATTVVLASDGYPKLYADLEQTEVALRAILERDPLCFRENRSTKGLQKGNLSFDDRSFLKLSVQ